jgi:hypothetical protein
MIAQRLASSSPPSEGQLDVVWRSTALRLTSRGMTLLFALGVGAVVTSAITSRFPLLGAVGIVVSAFACYAALIQPHGDRDVHPQLKRRLARLASAVAVLAGLTAGLLVLAAIFGGGIEVMRR